MVEVENLSKTFSDKRRGLIHAVERVTFSCAAGEVFGLLGPNGAGKTTALRMISTAIQPTEGSARVMGFDVLGQPAEVRRRLGFLAANTGLYGRLTPRETLRYFGRLFSMKESTIGKRTNELAAMFAMEEFLDRPCDKLSTGMKQKTNIARSILHDPPVIMLDEPTAGLDVITGRSIIDFVHASRRDGKTVLLSTHIMSEVERLCDRVGIIHAGRLRFVGTVAELRARHGGNLEDAFIQIVTEEPD